jgi:hypothetical protein
MIHALSHRQLRIRIGNAAQRAMVLQQPFARELEQYLDLFSPPVDLAFESVT